jgi:hypothetical protein
MTGMNLTLDQVRQAGVTAVHEDGDYRYDADNRLPGEFQMWVDDGDGHIEWIRLTTPEESLLPRAGWRHATDCGCEFCVKA